MRNGYVILACMKKKLQNHSIVNSVMACVKIQTFFILVIANLFGYIYNP